MGWYDHLKTRGLKYNTMENAAKGHNGSHDVGRNVGYGVTGVTPEVILDQIVKHHSDVDNAPSLDDNESASNSW